MCCTNSCSHRERSSRLSTFNSTSNTTRSSAGAASGAWSNHASASCTPGEGKSRAVLHLLTKIRCCSSWPADQL